MIFLGISYWVGFLYESQNDAYEKANNLLLSGDYISAIAEYDAYIEKYPDDYKAYNDKSLILADEDRYEEALEVINAIDTSKFSSDDAILSTIESNKCFYYYSLMQYDLARESCQKSLQYTPTNSIALMNTAMLYSTLGDTAKALEFVDDAIMYWDQMEKEEIFNVQGIDELYGMKGGILYSEWRNEEALEYYNKAIDLNPLSAQAYSNKAVILSEEWRNEEALEVIDTALALESREWPMYQVKWYILSELWRLEDAIVYYDKALSIIPEDFTTNFTKAFALFTLWRYQEAYDISLQIEGYQRTPEEEMHMDENIALQCMSLVSLEEYVGWLEKCNAYLKNYSPQAWEDNDMYLFVLDYKWLALAWLDRWTEALAIFEEVLRVDPENEIANQVFNELQ